MAKTKEKILTAALKLFNEEGFVNVRLQHIADEAFVSVGNLAYHYANKEAIIQALYEALAEKQEELLAEYRIVPLFDNLNYLFLHTYQLQEAYIFFYQDTLEIIRAYPRIGEIHRKHISSQIGQLKLMLDFNTARGALRAEPAEGTFDQLAQQIWMTMDFWRTQHAVRTNTPASEELYCDSIWQLLIPYFTEMGMREYIQMRQMPYQFFF